MRLLPSLALAALVVALPACSKPAPTVTAAPPSVTSVTSGMTTPTPAPAVTTVTASRAASEPPASNSAAPATTQPPAATDEPSAARPTETAQPATHPDASLTAPPSLWFISVGDGGPLGCGDTAVAAVMAPVTPTPVRDAMETLLTEYPEEMLGQSGLTNALHHSGLRYVDGHVDQAAGRVDVWLAGTLVAGGVCDPPRITAQLELTALNSAGAGVDKVMIWLNDQPLAAALDQRG